ncbi:putative TIM barrel metal-dependent hydrolase [Mollisia scopiformis]|uniref:Putative TIM barrel metal-dependent hydrolase n=1 Tax=Mollisia scopiformis TaxID=149040 RepID=A0A194WSV4_MOLSC|nr:putative TIM barrel metal-dependent hydrolase [Mollisia scopiformis]KUJ11033.1 putative TIM barrel metal-dependent hydrolase [Mollisia scopiformis]
MHIIDPIQYPLSPDAQYVPQSHLLSEALRFESSVGIQNIVLVQPSIYGFDNSCMLNALRQLGPHRARAVVAFDPATTTILTLEEWHKLGVRGVRVNLQSVGKKLGMEELASILEQYANLIRQFDWVLQLYVSLDTVAGLAEIIPKLGLKVCLDHFGHPSMSFSAEKVLNSGRLDPYSLPGFNSLIELLQEEQIYVKMSAPYRISRLVGDEDIEIVAKELLRVAGKKRVVFATDWPHTRFEGLDIRPFMEQVIEWCHGDKVLLERVFRGNAEDLWGVR